MTDIVRERKTAGTVEEIVRSTAARDGHSVEIMLEQEPAAAGKSVAERYKRHVLASYRVRSRRPTGNKTTAALPLAAAAENGLVKIVRHKHTTALLDELTSFPHGRHDDCVDALAGAHETLARNRGKPMTWSVPKGHISDYAPRGIFGRFSHSSTYIPSLGDAAQAQRVDRSTAERNRTGALLGVAYRHPHTPWS